MFKLNISEDGSMDMERVTVGSGMISTYRNRKVGFNVDSNTDIAGDFQVGVPIDNVKLSSNISKSQIYADNSYIPDIRDKSSSVYITSNTDDNLDKSCGISFGSRVQGNAHISFTRITGTPNGSVNIDSIVPVPSNINDEGEIDVIADYSQNEFTGEILISNGTRAVIRNCGFFLNLKAVELFDSLFYSVSNIGLFSQLIVSTDGINWIERPTPQGSWNTIVSGNGIFVLGGDKIAVSVQGLDWEISQQAPPVIFNKITFGNNLFVAATRKIGNEFGGIYTSINGFDWLYPMEAIPVLDFSDVIFNNDMFIIVGDSKILTSTNDGITWVESISPNLKYTRVVFGDSLYVAVASDGIATSPDGIIWTQINVPLLSYTGVSYGDGIYVASSLTGIAISPDGVSWVVKYEDNINQWSDVSYNNGLFVIVGGRRTLTFRIKVDNVVVLRNITRPMSQNVNRIYVNIISGGGTDDVYDVYQSSGESDVQLIVGLPNKVLKGRVAGKAVLSLVHKYDRSTDGEYTVYVNKFYDDDYSDIKNGDLFFIRFIDPLDKTSISTSFKIKDVTFDENNNISFKFSTGIINISLSDCDCLIFRQMFRNRLNIDNKGKVGINDHNNSHGFFINDSVRANGIYNSSVTEYKSNKYTKSGDVISADIIGTVSVFEPLRETQRDEWLYTLENKSNLTLERPVDLGVPIIVNYEGSVGRFSINTTTSTRPSSSQFINFNYQIGLQDPFGNANVTVDGIPLVKGIYYYRITAFNPLLNSATSMFFITEQRSNLTIWNELPIKDVELLNIIPPTNDRLGVINGRSTVQFKGVIEINESDILTASFNNSIYESFSVRAFADIELIPLSNNLRSAVITSVSYDDIGDVYMAGSVKLGGGQQAGLFQEDRFLSGINMESVIGNERESGIISKISSAGIFLWNVMIYSTTGDVIPVVSVSSDGTSYVLITSTNTDIIVRQSSGININISSSGKEYVIKLSPQGLYQRHISFNTIFPMYPMGIDVSQDGHVTCAIASRGRIRVNNNSNQRIGKFNPIDNEDYNFNEPIGQDRFTVNYTGITENPNRFQATSTSPILFPITELPSSDVFKLTENDWVIKCTIETGNTFSISALGIVNYILSDNIITSIYPFDNKTNSTIFQRFVYSTNGTENVGVCVQLGDLICRFPLPNGDFYLFDSPYIISDDVVTIQSDQLDIERTFGLLRPGRMFVIIYNTENIPAYQYGRVIRSQITNTTMRIIPPGLFTDYFEAEYTQFEDTSDFIIEDSSFSQVYIQFLPENKNFEYSGLFERRPNGIYERDVRIIPPLTLPLPPGFIEYPVFGNYFFEGGTQNRIFINITNGTLPVGVSFDRVYMEVFTGTAVSAIYPASAQGNSTIVLTLGSGSFNISPGTCGVSLVHRYSRFVGDIYYISMTKFRPTDYNELDLVNIEIDNSILPQIAPAIQPDRSIDHDIKGIIEDVYSYTYDPNTSTIFFSGDRYKYVNSVGVEYSNGFREFLNIQFVENRYQASTINPPETEGLYIEYSTCTAFSSDVVDVTYIGKIFSNISKYIVSGNNITIFIPVPVVIRVGMTVHLDTLDGNLPSGNYIIQHISRNADPNEPSTFRINTPSGISDEEGICDVKINNIYVTGDRVGLRFIMPTINPIANNITNITGAFTVTSSSFSSLRLTVPGFSNRMNLLVEVGSWFENLQSQNSPQSLYIFYPQRDLINGEYIHIEIPSYNRIIKHRFNENELLSTDNNILKLDNLDEFNGDRISGYVKIYRLGYSNISNNLLVKYPLHNFSQGDIPSFRLFSQADIYSGTVNVASTTTNRFSFFDNNFINGSGLIDIQVGIQKFGLSLTIFEPNHGRSNGSKIALLNERKGGVITSISIINSNSYTVSYESSSDALRIISIFNSESGVVTVQKRNHGYSEGNDVGLDFAAIGSLGVTSNYQYSGVYSITSVTTHTFQVNINNIPDQTERAVEVLPAYTFISTADSIIITQPNHSYQANDIASISIISNNFVLRDSYPVIFLSSSTYRLTDRAFRQLPSQGFLRSIYSYTAVNGVVEVFPRRNLQTGNAISRIIIKNTSVLGNSPVKKIFNRLFTSFVDPADSIRNGLGAVMRVLRFDNASNVVGVRAEVVDYIGQINTEGQILDTTLYDCVTNYLDESREYNAPPQPPVSTFDPFNSNGTARITRLSNYQRNNDGRYEISVYENYFVGDLVRLDFIEPSQKYIDSGTFIGGDIDAVSGIYTVVSTSETSLGQTESITVQSNTFNKEFFSGMVLVNKVYNLPVIPNNTGQVPLDGRLSISSLLTYNTNSLGEYEFSDRNMLLEDGDDVYIRLLDDDINSGVYLIEDATDTSFSINSLGPPNQSFKYAFMEKIVLPPPSPIPSAGISSVSKLSKYSVENNIVTVNYNSHPIKTGDPVSIKIYNTNQIFISDVIETDRNTFKFILSEALVVPSTGVRKLTVGRARDNIFELRNLTSNTVLRTFSLPRNTKIEFETFRTTILTDSLFVLRIVTGFYSTDSTVTQAILDIESEEEFILEEQLRVSFFKFPINMETITGEASLSTGSLTPQGLGFIDQGISAFKIKEGIIRHDLKESDSSIFLTVPSYASLIYYWFDGQEFNRRIIGRRIRGSVVINTDGDYSIGRLNMVSYLKQASAERGFVVTSSLDVDRGSLGDSINPNIYICGTCDGAIDFQNTRKINTSFVAGRTKNTRNAERQGAFICKLNSLGDAQWFSMIDGTDNEQAVSIAVDNNVSENLKGSYNFYVLCSFTSDVASVYDSRKGTLNIVDTNITPKAVLRKTLDRSNFAQRESFILKYNQEGSYIMTFKTSTDGLLTPIYIDVDSNDNVVACYKMFADYVSLKEPDGRVSRYFSKEKMYESGVLMKYRTTNTLTLVTPRISVLENESLKMNVINKSDYSLYITALRDFPEREITVEDVYVVPSSKFSRFIFAENKWNPASSEKLNSDLLFLSRDNGKFGFGTEIPELTLEIKGDLNISGDMSLSNLNVKENMSTNSLVGNSVININSNPLQFQEYVAEFITFKPPGKASFRFILSRVNGEFTQDDFFTIIPGTYEYVAYRRFGDFRDKGNTTIILTFPDRVILAEHEELLPRNSDIQRGVFTVDSPTAIRMETGRTPRVFSVDLKLTRQPDYTSPYNINRMSAFPKGSVIMWNGTVQDIPYGWVLCDGRSFGGTIIPDLRGRFVLGTNNATSEWSQENPNVRILNIGDVSGDTRAYLQVGNLPSHSHGIPRRRPGDLNDPANNSAGSITTTSSRTDIECTALIFCTPISRTTFLTRTTRYSEDISQAKLSIDDTTPFPSENNDEGDGPYHNNMPPYYVLMYIYKL
jgi:hypothetical protein